MNKLNIIITVLTIACFNLIVTAQQVKKAESGVFVLKNGTIHTCLLYTSILPHPLQPWQNSGICTKMQQLQALMKKNLKACLQVVSPGQIMRRN